MSFILFRHKWSCPCPLLTHISLNFLSEYSVEYKYECDKLVLLSFCVTYFVDRKFIVMLPLHNMCYVFLIVRYANYILLVLLPTTVMLNKLALLWGEAQLCLHYVTYGLD